MMQLMGIPPSAVHIQDIRKVSIAEGSSQGQPAWLLRPRLSLAGPPPLAPLRLRCLRLRRRLLPRLSRPCAMAIHSAPRGRLQGSRGENVLKPAATAPAAKPAYAVNLKTLDQRPRRRNVEDRLGYEGARQRRAVLLRIPGRDSTRPADGSAIGSSTLVARSHLDSSDCRGWAVPPRARKAARLSAMVHKYSIHCSQGQP